MKYFNLFKKKHSPLSEACKVASKRNGVTSYRFSRVHITITIKSNNVFYEPRALTIGTDNDFHEHIETTFPYSVEALCDNAKM